MGDEGECMVDVTDLGGLLESPGGLTVVDCSSMGNIFPCLTTFIFFLSFKVLYAHGRKFVKTRREIQVTCNLTCNLATDSICSSYPFLYLTGENGIYSFAPQCD